MKESTLDIWKKLQEEGYFKNHKLYKDRPIGIPHCVEMEEIKDKVIAEIGCGYGRDTALFSAFAKKVYAIDVCPKLLKKMQDNLFNFGDPTVVIPILADEYKEKIKSNLDYVYALHVFQHLAPAQAFDYVDTFFDKLKPGGKMNVQFYLGQERHMEQDQEPRVRYTVQQIMTMFYKFKIDKTWNLQKFDANNNLQYEHFYVIARKPNE